MSCDCLSIHKVTHVLLICCIVKDSSKLLILQKGINVSNKKNLLSGENLFDAELINLLITLPLHHREIYKKMIYRAY